MVPTLRADSVSSIAAAASRLEREPVSALFTADARDVLQALPMAIAQTCCPACAFEDHAMRFGRMPAGEVCPHCLASVDATITQPGWYLRSEILWERPNCQPESVKDRPTRAHEQIWLLSKSKSYFL